MRRERKKGRCEEVGMKQHGDSSHHVLNDIGGWG